MNGAFRSRNCPVCDEADDIEHGEYINVCQSCRQPYQTEDHIVKISRNMLELMNPVERMVFVELILKGYCQECYGPEPCYCAAGYDE